MLTLDEAKKKFPNMEGAEARIEIARDVLDRLKTKQFIAKHGEYVSWSYLHNDDMPTPTPKFENDKPLREQLVEAPPCEACALGAAFMSAVDKFNKCDVTDNLFDDYAREKFAGCSTAYGIKPVLKRFFDDDQLVEIESAFEGWGPDRDGSEQDYTGLVKHEDKADVRLSMIMKNIIRHNGTFVATSFVRRLKIAVQGCAIGKLEDAADALEEAEKTLDQLDIAGCMDVCSDLAKDCLEDANGTCVDQCEVEEDTCEGAVEYCSDSQKAACTNLSGPAYYSCVDAANEYCEQDCDGDAGDCIQACGEEAQECLVGDDNLDVQPNFSDCMTSCIKELEDDLKGIDL
jgi:hypothetical protein